jgi:hypothetical protein
MIEDLYTGKMIRLPRKIKKYAKRDGYVITARMGKTLLAVSVD